jgi:hypothetical protein
MLEDMEKLVKASKNHRAVDLPKACSRVDIGQASSARGLASLVAALEGPQLHKPKRVRKDNGSHNPFSARFLPIS